MAQPDTGLSLRPFRKSTPQVYADTFCCIITSEMSTYLIAWSHNWKRDCETLQLQNSPFRRWPCSCKPIFALQIHIHSAINIYMYFLSIWHCAGAMPMFLKWLYGFKISELLFSFEYYCCSIMYFRFDFELTQRINWVFQQFSGRLRSGGDQIFGFKRCQSTGQDSLFRRPQDGTQYYGKFN